MRRTIACMAVLLWAAAAQPAGAIDGGFHGRYRVIERATCHSGTQRYRVHIRYVSERVRRYDRIPAIGAGSRLRYERGERFPWQGRVKLRYHRRTDSAVGITHHPQSCNWRLRLVPIGRDRSGKLFRMAAQTGWGSAVPARDRWR